MKKRVMSLLLCISMLCGVLAGCGSSSDNGKETEENTQQNTQENTQQNTESTSTEEEEAYYRVDEYYLEASLSRLFNLAVSHYGDIKTKKVQGSYPDSAYNFAKYCKTGQGGTTILQGTHKDIIFTENYCENDGDWEEIYSMVKNAYSKDSYMMVEIIGVNFDGEFVYKEGTEQVIKVIADIRYTNLVTSNLFVIEFVKEASNNDVWLINSLEYFEYYEDYEELTGSQQGFYDYLMQTKIGDKLANEDGTVVEVKTPFNDYIKKYLADNGLVMDSFIPADLNNDSNYEIVAITTSGVVLVFAENANGDMSVSKVDNTNIYDKYVTVTESNPTNCLGTNISLATHPSYEDKLILIHYSEFVLVDNTEYEVSNNYQVREDWVEFESMYYYQFNKNGDLVLVGKFDSLVEYPINPDFNEEYGSGMGNACFVNDVRVFSSDYIEAKKMYSNADFERYRILERYMQQ